ncbi:DUF461 domain-containing protein [Streptomyces sp. DH24]|uniref:DUF461 domain-containing protein n=1 Tax=Streptomyces sp. DH24 TaxID=3040123 RepID=UPI00244224F2|nr:DUF461 domain-containing protein [Streptomyces sp. DH24]MDG9718665.1 DUF461 domain-containing protein [Streptomyces sp. DH24]
MSSSLRRGALAAAVIAVSIASLAACGAGHNAQTLGVRPDNAATAVDGLKIQNAVVVTQPDKESTGPAVVSATVFNSGSSAETLESITVEGAGEAKLTPAKGKTLSIPAGGSLIIGGKDNASAVLAGGGESLVDGDAQKVTFTFSRTGAIDLRAFVVPSEGYYASWGPTGAPAAPGASASASAPEEPGDHASGEATGEPSEGASATPGGSATPTDAASASASAAESEDHAAAGH